MKYWIVTIIIVSIVVGCGNSHERFVVDGVSWQQVELEDFEYEIIDTVWTDHDSVHLLNFVKPKHFTFDERISNLLLVDEQRKTNTKLESNISFSIRGDTMYHMISPQNNNGWNGDGMEWYEVKRPNNYHYTRLWEGVAEIPTPSIEDSYGQILRFNLKQDSTYAMVESIGVGAITSVLDLKAEGVYYVGLPGLNVVAKNISTILGNENYTQHRTELKSKP